MTGMLEDYGTTLGLFTSALGAHLTWTLPFGLLIMFAVFNRFNPATRRPRAIWAPRPGRPSGMWCCR
jgi:ABC-type spermidine/putrescine transport system permease subunit II